MDLLLSIVRIYILTGLIIGSYTAISSYNQGSRHIPAIILAGLGVTVFWGLIFIMDQIKKMKRN